jgi:beta-glucosidase-like glycosyl hydrolase
MPRVILGMREAHPSPALREAITAGRLGGLLWFREALGSSVEEAAERVGNLRALWPPGVPCLFAADEEGGLIQQLCGLSDANGAVWPRLPSARALGRSGDSDLAFAHGREVGRRMRTIGLDVALAPVVDLDPGPSSAVLGTRCFGDDPDEVARMAVAWLRGMASAGVRGCIKHFPGHGATRFDSHRELPRIGTDVDPARHMRPFKEIARAWSVDDGPPPGVLTAHLVRDGGRLPVTLDPIALSEVPDSLGPIWTDSLDMGALAPYGGLEARARAALTAGSDLLVVGVDIDGGLALARSLGMPVSPRVARWIAGTTTATVPAPWPLDEIVRAAAPGVRVLQDAPLIEGDWDWILPERFGPYGIVPVPPVHDAEGVANRRIARIIRYDAGDPESLRRALREDVAAAALVGWIHRGGIDAETEKAIRSGRTRVRAIVHLLDGPEGAMLPGIWTCETCGFGEGELSALAQLWGIGRAEI